MNSRRYVLVILGVLSIVLVRPVAATVIRAVSLEESIAASESIIVGRVVDERVFWSEDRLILTAVAVHVEESLKGPHAEGDVIEVTTAGGELDGQRMVAPGAASYERGQRVLLQLELVEGRLESLGLSAGKWNVVRDPTGRDFVVRDLSSLGIVGGIEMPTGPIPLDDFRRVVGE